VIVDAPIGAGFDAAQAADGERDLALLVEEIGARTPKRLGLPIHP
jgi:hypothetical protein